MRVDGRFRAVAEGIGAAVVVSDPDGVVRYANAVAHDLFAALLTDSDVPFVGSRVTDHGWRLLAEDGRELPMSSNAAGRARASGEAVRDHVVGMVVGDRAPLWLVQSAVPFPHEDEPGRFDVVSTFVDITARRELEARLEQQAGSDPLTGLANRFRYEERLRESAARADRASAALALLLVDVDDFKSCNDLHGHGVGDGVLVEVAARLRSLVRGGDTVARLGGDEFALVVEGATDACARAVGDRTVAAFNAPVRPARGRRGLDLRVSVSVGIAVRSPGGSLPALEQAADDALFAAKHAGKGTAVLHDPEVELGPALDLPVEAEEARAWATYVDALRTEIGACKADGRLPATTGAPPSVLRVLQDVLARVERLPTSGPCNLTLPRERDLAPFVFHHDSVNRWVARLRREGVLEVVPPPEAQRFWRQLAAAVEVVGV